MTKRYCLALDLKPDPELIAAYEAHHLAVWPEILASIRDSGILHLEIYRIENRLFMIIETAGNFSFEKKALADAENEKVQERQKIKLTARETGMQNTFTTYFYVWLHSKHKAPL